MFMIDLDSVLRLRLVVARHGEMDVARWWNTTNMLGPKGSAAVARGLPRTHYLARARAVFSVAHQRCREVYGAANITTLWDLPPEVEAAFDERWSVWLDQPELFAPVFAALARINAASDILGSLGTLLSSREISDAKRLRKAADGRSVSVGTFGSLNNEVVALLAAGFCRAEPTVLTVPFATIGGR